jgi:hypothetical protein
MKPQLRTYLLVVGRDNDDQPVRKLAKYTGRPLKGWGDHYRLMTAPELVATEARVKTELELCQEALDKIEDEKVERLSRRFPQREHEIEELMRDD